MPKKLQTQTQSKSKVKTNEKLSLEEFLAKSLSEDSDIWQINLVSDKDLCNLARDRGLSFWCLDDSIKRLWQIGLLKADLVVSEAELKIKHLVFLKKDEYERYVYKDERDCLLDKKGLGGIIARLPNLPKNINLQFHPFRYYVLRRIEILLESNISDNIILYNPNAYHKFIDRLIDFFQRFTSTAEFIDLFRKINRTADLAISCEPITFRQVFGFSSVNIRHYNNPEKSHKEYHRSLKKYSNGHKKILKAIGLNEIQEIHSELCINAHLMDRNIDLHQVLRFTKKDYRLKKVKGNIGGTMYLIAMAEIIRRAAENVFRTELPEEDEIVYPGVQAVKVSVYGSRRITEDNKAKREFLRNFGLDYTIRLRWYVEGYTEFGALKLILGNHHFIELINLSGLIVAGSKKGLAFKDNLLNDIKTSIYSWVLIDGDNTDIVNVLKNAAKADEMFGMFFISNPDFEFGNFTRDELVEIVWEWAKEFNVEEENKQKLKEVTALSNSAKDFFKAVEKAIPYQPQICKGEVWGEKLIRYADKHPKMKLPDGKQIERPVISAIRNALFSHNTNYQRARKEGKVDIETGNIIYPERK